MFIINYTYLCIKSIICLRLLYILGKQKAKLIKKRCKISAELPILGIDIIHNRFYVMKRYLGEKIINFHR